MSQAQANEIVTPVDVKPGKLSAILYLFGALIYFISPIDILPDVIPLLCHVDDFAIAGMAFRNACKAFN